jgi:hypothetical protein
VVGCCECGDEPSGSCATELVRVILYYIYLVNITYVPTYFNDFLYMFMYTFCILILHKNPDFSDHTYKTHGRTLQDE